MIMLDLGATASDISNRTVIFSLRPEIRTRLATIYMIGKFGGAGIAGMADRRGLGPPRLARRVRFGWSLGGDGVSDGARAGPYDGAIKCR